MGPWIRRLSSTHDVRLAQAQALSFTSWTRHFRRASRRYSCLSATFFWSSWAFGGIVLFRRPFVKWVFSPSFATVVGLDVRVLTPAPFLLEED